MLLPLLMTLIGCGSGDDVAVDTESDGIVVVDAWTRMSPATVNEAALYVTLENRAPSDDQVISVGSERCVTVVPHLTRIDDAGVASMQSIGDALSLPAGGSIEMEPNGLHLMCLGLDEPLTVGDSLALVVDFAASVPVTVQVAVENR